MEVVVCFTGSATMNRWLNCVIGRCSRQEAPTSQTQLKGEKESMRFSCGAPGHDTEQDKVLRLGILLQSGAAPTMRESSGLAPYVDKVLLHRTVGNLSSHNQYAH